VKQSELNHLRRLLGWVRCEIGQTPDEVVETARVIADAGIQPGEYGKQALVEAHDKARRVPKYVRAAEKALSQLVKNRGEIANDTSTSANVAQRPVSPDGRVIDKAIVKRLAVQHGLIPLDQIWCQDCGDGITAHDPGVCGNCLAMKYDANSKDAARYRFLRERPPSVEPDRIDVVYWSALDESANEGEALRGDALDAAIDAAIAQAQEV
jgi:hypothetical protein